MQCPFCHTQNPAQARFCMGCGSRLIQGQVCPACHTVLPPQAHYCFHCGSYVGPADVTIQPLTAPSIVGESAPEPEQAPTFAPPASPPTAASGPTDLPSSPRLPEPRPLPGLLPSLQHYLPASLYEPLERRPKEPDLLAVRDHLTALLQACKTYLPYPVVAAPQPPGIPTGKMQSGVFLFGDVSGFTPLSEKLKTLGQAGAEQITAIINALFTELVKVLFAHGGMLLKFGGDAMLGMWPVESGAEMSGPALRACQAALAIQEVMKQPQFGEIIALGEKHKLMIKVGISAGPFFAAHIGTRPGAESHGGTMAYVTTGETVNQAEEAEGHAHPGQVAMSARVADLLSGQIEVAPVEREPDPAYRRLLAAPTLAENLQAAAGSQEPPSGPVDAQITYLVDRLDRLVHYLSPELIKRIVTNPHDARIQPEHRPVTVMFVNYKGIGKLIEKHGEREPELITQHLNNYFCKMASIVERYEGTLARMDQYAVGDRIVIFFGAPRAHEDDPTRAVYTALEMQEAVRANFAALRTGSGVFRFEQRVGINTGHLFAGNVGAPDLRQEYTLMGDDINMAARLMSNAPWGQVYLSRRTHDQVAAFIEMEDRGEIKVKGKEIKIPTFAATGRFNIAGRTRGLGRSDSPLTGRDAQVQALQAQAQAFLKGRGQILTIMGQSGMGKSRLLRELRAWIGQQPEGQAVQWIEARALSFSEQTGYWMASQMMRGLLGIPPGASQDDVLFRLSELGEQLLGEQVMDAIPYLADMMGLDLGEEWAWVKKDDPKVRQKQTFWAAAEFLTACARQHPLVIALDDLHWADEASLALFGHLLKITDQAPVSFCLLFRPQREQNCWKLRDMAAAQFPHRYFELSLVPLDKAQSSLLLDRLLPGARLPTEYRNDILTKAAGNPFYLEEMVRSLIEAQAVTEDPQQPGTYKVTDRIVQIAIPVNLHAAIAARIDRLTEDARQVLQLASVLGRQFRLELLSSLTQATKEIYSWLAQLERGGLVSTTGDASMLYSFPDALIHEVAYDSLLVMRRQQIHRQVGELLEVVYHDSLDTNSGLLAYHFSKSDDAEKSLLYLKMAAKKSEEQYAIATAITYYQKMLEIYRAQGNQPGQASTLYAMGVKAYETGDYEDALLWLSEASTLQRQLDDPQNEAWSTMYLGMIALKQGNYPRALQYHQDALDNARQRQDRFQEGIHLTNLARVNMRLGRYELAYQQFKQSLELKQANNDLLGQAFACFYLGLTSLYMHYEAGAQQHLAESLDLWQQVPFNERGLAYVEQGLGLLALSQRQPEKAVQYLRSALARCEKLVLKAEQIETLSHLGQALLATQDIPGACDVSNQAIQLLEKQKDVEEQQQVFFNHYRVLKTAGDPQAEGYLQRAAAVMQEQAGHITDPAFQRDFLAQVLVNLAIQSASQNH